MNFSNPALTASGNPGCQHHDCNLSRWRSNSTSRETAVGVVVVIGQKYDNGKAKAVGTTVFLCKRHLGTVKSLITRGVSGYSTRTYRIIPNAVPQYTDRDSLAAAAVGDYNAETRMAEQARRNYISENSERLRTEHLTTGYSQPVSVEGKDEYGRVFVSVNYRKMTPFAAEKMAADLLAAAAKARAKMEE